MKYDATHILTSLKNDVKAQGHLEIRKMKIKDANLFNTVEFCIKKKQWLNRNISVIQLSDRVYNVTFPAYDIYSLRLRLRENRT